MNTFTHPIYQSGPLADALATFQKREEQMRLEAQALAQTRQQEKAANLANLMDIARQRFGDLWPFIEPCITNYSSNWEHRIIIEVTLPEIWPFVITQERNGYTRIDFHYPPNHTDHRGFSPTASIDEGVFAHILIEGHQLWLDQEQARQAHQTKKNNLLAYAEAWRDYERNYASILAKNEMALALLQEQYTTTFPVWRLTFGVTAYNDDEGEFCADTRGVWVLSPDPDDDGFFSVIDDTGQVTYRKYYSLVCLEGPQTFHAEPGSTYCGHLHVKEANDSIYFSPLLNYAEVLTRVRSWVEANMHPLPEFPHYGAFGLSERPDQWEMEEIEQELARDDDEEIPF